MKKDNWSNLHRIYSSEDWVSKPSLFAMEIKEYLPVGGALLDLGAGVGQDSLFFSSLGYSVTATDLETDHLNNLSNKNVLVTKVDLRELLPFEDSSFDVVYAHLSLHYFDQIITKQIFEEIYRILKPGGILAFFTNSTDDPEYGTGNKIEDDFFEIEGILKRYFTTQSAAQFAQSFTPLLVDNKGETYKDSAKGIHNLIRYVGQK